MQPKLTLLSDEIIARILEEAYELLLKTGIKVQNAEARDLLAAAGAIVDPKTDVEQIPASLVHKALETVPRDFYLYDYDGNPTVHYGGDSVHFDPGSSGITMLNPETLEKELLASYRRPEIDPDKESRLHAFVLDLAKKCGLEQLPRLEDYQPM
jgi:trimethylamine:corrinoid methyltransferase-like protein